MGLGELGKAMNANKQPEFDSIGAEKLTSPERCNYPFGSGASSLCNDVKGHCCQHSYDATRTPTPAPGLSRTGLREAVRRHIVALGMRKPHPLIDALEAALASADVDAKARPEIITLCGSSRFVAEMAVIAWGFEKDGKITMGLHLLPEWYETKCESHLAEAEGVAAQMDELHLRKIDLADRVFVVNKDGYIGESTRREIEYAKKTGKPVIYLEALANLPAGEEAS